MICVASALFQNVSYFCNSDICRSHYSTCCFILSRTHSVHQWPQIVPIRSFRFKNCPNPDCLALCIGLCPMCLILRLWQHKKNDYSHFFLLRWHNRNITEIYYNSFLIQILFLMSCVTLGKQPLRHLPQYSVQSFQYAGSCAQLWTYRIRISLSGISGMYIFSDTRWYYILG